MSAVVHGQFRVEKQDAGVVSVKEIAAEAFPPSHSARILRDDDRLREEEREQQVGIDRDHGV